MAVLKLTVNTLRRNLIIMHFNHFTSYGVNFFILVHKFNKFEKNMEPFTNFEL